MNIGALSIAFSPNHMQRQIKHDCREIRLTLDQTNSLMKSIRHRGETPPNTKLRTQNFLIEKPNTILWPDSELNPGPRDLQSNMFTTEPTSHLP